MYIFIDSNIFHNNWFVTQANFRYLFNYISNTQAKLLISELVCEEVHNNRQKELNDILATLNQSIAKTKKLNREPVDYDFSKLNQPYDFKNILDSMPGDKVYFPYDQIQQSVVVKRALKKVRPFQEGEKGYRDTLIWLSLLDFLKKKNYSGEVVFINNNDSDFFIKPENVFQADLLNDIQAHGLECKFSIFDSLYKFVSSKIEKTKHQIAFSELNSRYFQDLEDEFTTETVSFLNSMNSDEFLSFIRKTKYNFPYVNYVIAHDFDCWEGLEDGEVMDYESLTDNELYVRYSYNLRRCIIDLVIPVEDYHNNKLQIDSYYHNVLLKGEYVILSFYVRAYFEATFTYLIKENSFKGINIEWIHLDAD